MRVLSVSTQDPSLLLDSSAVLDFEKKITPAAHQERVLTIEAEIVRITFNWSRLGLQLGELVSSLRLCFKARQNSETLVD